MRTINRTAILDLIRRESPVSRSYISEALGTSLPTVMRFVDGLLEEKLVRQLDEKESTGGRKRALLELNTQENVVIGVNLANHNTFGAIADIGGAILKEIEIPRTSEDAEQNFNELVSLIKALLSAPELKDKRVLGIGVGAPGVTHHKDGVVIWAPTLNWRDFPLKERLGEIFHLPIIADNDVNLSALGELWYGAGKGLRNVVVISLGMGTGAAIILDGFLYRGSHEAAGEIGYEIPGREFLGKPRMRFGSMEQVSSGFWIAERARKQLAGALPDEELKAITAKDIFLAVADGKEWARPIYDETIDYLAMMVSNITSIVDPEAIIFTGSISKSADLFIPDILKRLDNLQAVGVELNLKMSPLGMRGVVLGAITNVLNSTSEQYVVRKID